MRGLGLVLNLHVAFAKRQNLLSPSVPGGPGQGSVILEGTENIALTQAQFPGCVPPALRRTPRLV